MGKPFSLNTLRHAVRIFAAPVMGLVAAARRRKRMLLVVTAMLVPVIVAASLLAATAVVVSSAAFPPAIAGKVLVAGADLLDVAGNGDADEPSKQLVAAGAASHIDCRPIPPTTSAALPGPRPEAPEPAHESDHEPAPQDSALRTVEPIDIGADGAISRADTAAVVDPVPPKTSAVTAHTWFLYRLAGLGDWDTFSAAYRAAGLRGADGSDNAPLAQVQTLNTAGADVDRYRMTAASLTLAGILSGRFDEPYSDYRQLVSNELITACLEHSDFDAQRASLPAPSLAIDPEPPSTSAPVSPEPGVEGDRQP